MSECRNIIFYEILIILSKCVLVPYLSALPNFCRRTSSKTSVNIKTKYIHIFILMQVRFSEIIELGLCEIYLERSSYSFSIIENNIHWYFLLFVMNYQWVLKLKNHVGVVDRFFFLMAFGYNNPLWPLSVRVCVRKCVKLVQGSDSQID